MRLERERRLYQLGFAPRLELDRLTVGCLGGREDIAECLPS